MLKSSSTEASTLTSSLGWWTRRIHITEYHPSPSRGATKQQLDEAVVGIIGYCPNLEIFIADRSLGLIFGTVADTIAANARNALRTVSWNVPGDTVDKVIWACSLLPFLSSAHLHVESPPLAESLGSASNVEFSFSHLKQLSLRGYIEQVVEHAIGYWHLPGLLSFAVSTGSSVNDVPDIEGFLAQHGTNLVYLDLDTVEPLAVPKILDFCPNLLSFAFNADWEIKPDFSQQTPGSVRSSGITRRPHPTITHIGLHGLSNAFLSDTATARLSSLINRDRRLNDQNMAALHRGNFPKLTTIRAVNQRMLMDLNVANGPSQSDGGYERWSRWWDTCTAHGLRLEDCTGQPLGTLPIDEESDDSEEDSDGEDEDGESSDDDEDDDDSDESSDEDDNTGGGPPVDDEYRKFWESTTAVAPLSTGNGGTGELSRLLQEVRAFNLERDEGLMARIRPPRPRTPPGR